MSDTEILELSRDIYPLEAIYRASYLFTDRAYLLLEPGHTKQTIRVRLTAKNGEPLKSLLGEFLNELLDHSLRRSIATETREVRLALLNMAFVSVVRPSKTGNGENGA